MTDFSDLSGEPASLKTYATRYLSIADAIQSASAALKAVGEGSDSMVSLSVDAIRAKAKTGGEDIAQAESRYRTTAQALLTYSTALEAAQDKAKEARADHETAKGNQTAAQAKADEFADKALVPGADQAGDSRSATAWENQASLLASSVGAAETKYNEAVADKEAAGNIAADAIEQIISDDGISDSWWDKLVDFCEKIGDWVAIAALLLSWVPILGQVLLAVAAIISIIKLIDSLIKFASGEMTLGEVVAAAVGVVLSIVGGKALMVAIKGLKTLRKGSKAIKAANKAAERVAKGKTGKKAVKKTEKIQAKADKAKDKYDKSVRKLKEEAKDAFTVSKNDIKKELKETFVKPFTDLRDAVKNPAELDEALQVLVREGDKPDFLKTLDKKDWDDMSLTQRTELVIQVTDHFGPVAETVLAPVTDVPLTLEGVVNKGTDAVSDRVGDYVDGVANR